MASASDSSGSERGYSRRELLQLGVGAAASMLAGPLLSTRLSADSRPPSIIFILADDLGWGDLGCYGHPHIKTPNLDRLAKQGTRFTNFYVCGPVCSPSRAACVTGMFPSRTRIHYALPNQLEEPQKQAGMAEFLDPIWMTIPRALKNGGYTTAHIGKWHLGTSPSAPEVTEYGFDVSKAILGKPNAWKDGPKNDPYFRAHSTGLFVDEGIRFIENNRERPFFLNLWTLAPHATLQPTPEQMRPYSGPQFNPGEQTGYSGAMAVYYSVVTDVDAQLGRLLDKLDELKLSDNTIVIFSSDNGPEDIHVPNASHSGVGTPGPFRGRKRSLYDGGIRMPFIVRWPGMVPAGMVNDSSVLAGVDLLPTFAAIAGTTLPKDTAIDGEDISDILRGSARQRKTTLYWEYRFAVAGDTINRSPQLAIREDNWKLLMNRDGSRVELYDLSRTHTEVDNLADQHPDVAKRLSEKLLAWKKTLPPGEYAPGSGIDSYPWPE